VAIGRCLLGLSPDRAPPMHYYARGSGFEKPHYCTGGMSGLACVGRYAIGFGTGERGRAQ